MRGHFTLFIAALLCISTLMGLASQSAEAAPVTTLTVGGPTWGTSPLYVNDFTTFTLEAVSSGATVTDIWYRWDDADFLLRYDDPFTAITYPYDPEDTSKPPAVPMELLGEHTLHYFASDDTGTNETEQSFTVVVDPTPPVTSVNFIGTNYESSSINHILPDTNLSMSAEDPAVGVDKTYYSQTNANFKEYSSPFTIYGTGNHTLYYYSIDNLGNQELTKTLSLYVDDEEPEVEISFGDPTYNKGTTVYASTFTDITITASDESGISLKQYNLDGNDWITYTGMFYLTQSGAHQLNYRAMDNLGLIHSESLSIYLDNGAPVVTHNLPGTGPSFVVEYETSLEFNVTDQENPDAEPKLYVSVDDGNTWSQYSAPIILRDDTNLSYYAEDLLGNTSPVKEITIHVNSSGGFSQYYIYWIIILGIGIPILLYINRDFFKKKPEEEIPEKKAKRKKR